MDEPNTVRESLRRLDDESHELYVEELRRLEAPEPEDMALDWNTPMGQFLRADGESVLGPGMPQGASLRADGQSHREAWKSILRMDPCAYCDARPSATIDHIEPRSKRNRQTETWLNYTGACESCNGNKAHHPLLFWLRRRRATRENRRAHDLRWAAMAPSYAPLEATPLNP